MGDRTGVVGSSFERASAALAEDLAGRWVSAAQADRVIALACGFERFCRRGFDVTELALVTPAVAYSYIGAPTADGGRPTHSVQRARRSALRLLFRAGRQLGLVDGDPTLDVALPSLSTGRARPLTDEEIVDCRAASAWSLGATRPAATWALAEATCRSGEIPRLTVGDVDLDASTVRITGGGRCEPRTAQLNPWALEQVRRRIAVVGSDPTRPLVYEGSDARLGGLVSANSTITQILERAGLSHEPDVRPSSVVAWGGAKVLETTGRIDKVAEALGLRSLDGAATFIGWDWQEPGDEVTD
ncbi:MAG: hypothetical protein JWR83_2 [Aeromicrobium sp.]|nr:hypothetical protein [Aeromicrobium sp.]